MKKLLVNILCGFVPSKKLRHAIRHKCLPRRIVGDGIDWESNHIWIVAPDGTRRAVRSLPGCEFKIRGKNNNICLHEPVGKLKLRLDISSNVNITIYPVHSWVGADIFVWRATEECNKVVNLNIGAGFSSTTQLKVSFTQGGGGDVTIGNDCMFSWGVSIHNGDYHTMLDNDTKKVLNHNKSIVIGNHVWVGGDALFLKGAQIADNSIVGMRSVVTHKFNEPNVAIAGVPARIVKRNVNWDRHCIADYEAGKRQ